MATIIFDGTTSQTASKATDTVVFQANPALFTGAAEVNGNVVLTFGAQTLTVTGTTLAANGLSNITVPGGSLTYATAANATTTLSTSGNNLAFLLGAGSTTTLGGGSNNSTVTAAFGGLGRADSVDNAETIAIAAGSKGSYLIYGNEGADTITAGNLDSGTATTIFGGRGSDGINLGQQSGAGSNFAVYGGEGSDTITLNHTAATGNVTIFGGTAAADPNDLSDRIALSTGSAGSSFNVYAGAGDDIVTSDGLDVTFAGLAGKVATFAEGTSPNIFGGNGADSISVGAAVGAKATITVAGGAGADAIFASNNEGGTTTIFGGTGAADPNDGNDSITISGAGSFTVYANSGNDSVVATGLTTSTNGVTSATIFGGRGDDNINAGSLVNGKLNLAILGGENASEGGDVITAANVAGGSTIIYGGTAAADAADGADTINFSGQGTTTIFAAGGNDSVNIKGLSTAFTNTSSTDTIYGGGGNDSITISGAQATNGTHIVTLGDGADIFVAGARDNSALNTAPALGTITDGGTGTFEAVTVTFSDLTAGNTATVGGVSFKANVDLTAGQVATKFAAITGTSTQDTLNATATDGVWAINNQAYTFAGSALNTTAGTVRITATTDGNKTDITTARAAGAANGSGQTIDIKDFSLAQNDTLVVQNGVAAGGALQIVDASGAQTIQSALDLAVSSVATNPAGSVSAVLFQNNAYIVVNNDGNATFNANTDLAIKLTGVTTLTGLAAATTIV